MKRHETTINFMNGMCQQSCTYIRHNVVKTSRLVVFIVIYFSQIYCLGQGLNNDYKIDSEDIKAVFEEQGIHIFKYPFKLKKGEYVSIGCEVYEKGKLIRTNHFIEDFQIDNDIRINHHIAKKDSMVFYRFYFFENSDSLKMRGVFNGISPVLKFDLSNVAMGGFNARTDIPKDLIKKHELFFYYGLLKGGEKIKQSDGWLDCSSGLSKDKLIDEYDFVIMFYAEKITKERAITILDEIKESKSGN